MMSTGLALPQLVVRYVVCVCVLVASTGEPFWPDRRRSLTMLLRLRLEIDSRAGPTNTFCMWQSQNVSPEQIDTTDSPALHTFVVDPVAFGCTYESDGAPPSLSRPPRKDISRRLHLTLVPRAGIGCVAWRYIEPCDGGRIQVVGSFVE